MRFLIVLMCAPFLFGQAKNTDPVWLPTWDELGELAVELDASGYFAIPAKAGQVLAMDAENLLLLNGNEWDTGDKTLVPGVYINDGPYPITLHIPKTGQEVPLAPQAIIRIGSATTTVVSLPDKTVVAAGPGCSCVSGYWACCWIMDGRIKRCTCYKDGDEPPGTCIQGGTGSSSCNHGGDDE